MKNGLKPDEKPDFKYTAQLSSALINGEVKLVVNENCLSVTSVFDAAELPFTDMTALEFADYAVTIRATDGSFVFSRMGNWTRPFYDALCTAYNGAVKKALFIDDNPIISTRSEYQCAEADRTFGGVAPAMVYDECVCILPPDTNARRIPMCFLTDIEKSDFELTLKLAGDKYSLRRMGYDTDSFIMSVEKQMRAMREKTLKAVRELDPTLSQLQAAEISRLMPLGAAAPMGKLGEISPSFIEMLEKKLGNSRAANTYKVFCELCDPSQIYIGFKKDETPAAAEGDGISNVLGGLSDKLGGLDAGDILLFGGDNPVPRDPYMLWLVVPSPDGHSCAVEFAGDMNDAAATFVYRFDGDFNDFARRLNLALEAISFKREVISLSEAELSSPDYVHYRMAVQRNAALKLVRSAFVGRVIHLGNWRQKLETLWTGGTLPAATRVTPKPVPKAANTIAAQMRFCTSCGAEQKTGARFCGKCGAAQ